MADAQHTPAAEDDVIADIRGIADDDRTPPATRLRALELLAKLAGLFSERRRARQVRIVRLTPPLRLPRKGAEHDDHPDHPDHPA